METIGFIVAVEACDHEVMQYDKMRKNHSVMHV